MTAEPPVAERSGARRLPEGIAAGLHDLVGVFFYLPSGLVTPLYGLILLALIWLALFFVVLRWRPANAWLALLVPVGAAAIWFAVLMLGGEVLGWTA